MPRRMNSSPRVLLLAFVGAFTLSAAFTPLRARGDATADAATTFSTKTTARNALATPDAASALAEAHPGDPDARYFNFPISDADIAVARRRLSSGDPALRSKLDARLSTARALLAAQPPHVLEKEGRLADLPEGVTLPTFDLRDYLAFSRYAWPDPESPDGLPYITRDGVPNARLVEIGDADRAGRMFQSIERLAVAYLYSAQEAFARKAVEHLETWFLDETTGMRPHLEFGLITPGHAGSSHHGIISMRHLSKMGDILAALAPSSAWTPEHDEKMDLWLRAWTRWLTESDLGHGQRLTPNNHGTWYDAQRISLHLIFNARAHVERLCRGGVQMRFRDQIDASGRQPLEVRRSDALSYSLFNLNAFMTLTILCDRVGVDVSSPRLRSGFLFRKALAYVAPALKQRKHWPHSQRSSIDVREHQVLMAWARARRLVD